MEKGCHNCNFHCMNHKSCDVNGICKQGEKWEAIPDPLAVFIPPREEKKEEPKEQSEPRNEQLTCPHTYHTRTGYCKSCGLYNSDKNIL